MTLEVPLTHKLLGDLVAARRPTVSTAIASLARAGSVERTETGWLLRDGPPPELTDLTAVAGEKESGLLPMADEPRRHSLTP